MASATWQCYSIPLQKPLTTGATTKCRQGFIFQLVLEQDNQFFGGIGEVAPLPGKPPAVTKTAWPRSCHVLPSGKHHDNTCLYRANQHEHYCLLKMTHASSALMQQDMSRCACHYKPLGRCILPSVILAGLHMEGLQQAEQQLALLCQAVSGLQVPLNLSMMQVIPYLLLLPTL